LMRVSVERTVMPEPAIALPFRVQVLRGFDAPHTVDPSDVTRLPSVPRLNGPDTSRDGR